jgi:hypothetical protein
MGYLNNETITVEAVLTRRGRELLASENGLNITSFALADDEIDYTLYDPNHPDGSQYYDAALRSMPIFEPLTDETQSLKYKLVTLPSGTQKIPVIELGQQDILLSKNYQGVVTISPTTDPVYNTTLGYTAVLSNNSVGTLEGQGVNASASASAALFLGDTSSEKAITAVGLTFIFRPNASITKDETAQLTIIGNESGGSRTIPVRVYLGEQPEAAVTNAITTGSSTTY